MKILIIAENRHNSYGGIETYNNLLIDILSQQNHLVYEYAFNLNPERIDVKKHNNKAIALNKTPKTEAPLSLYAKRKIMKNSIKEITSIFQDFDLIIDSTSNVAWPKNIYNYDKWIYVQHFNPNFYKQHYICGKFLSPLIYFGMWVFGIKNPFNHFKNFVFYSLDDKESYKNKKMISSTCISLARFTEKQIKEFQNNHRINKAKSFVYAGRIDDFQKNIQYTKKKFSNLKILIDFYGMGDKKYIKDNKYCKFLGLFNNANISSILSKYKFNILLSKYEGFGYSIVEAMSLGIVSITTNCFKSCNNILENRGFIVDKYNIDKTLKNCNNMSDEEYNILSNRCFEFAKDNFSIEVFSKKWIEFINRF